MNFKESQTRKNLQQALQGEALAHLKYQFYRSKLTDLNKAYEPLLDEIIHNEKEHGKIWFKQLHDGEVPDNTENLLDAIEGEQYECHEMYVKFGEEAKEEGFDGIANLFFNVAKIECGHAEEFKKIREEIENDLFKSDDETSQWKCLNCGHIVIGKDAPLECPICRHPQKYFKKI